VFTTYQSEKENIMPKFVIKEEVVGEVPVVLSLVYEGKNIILRAEHPSFNSNDILVITHDGVIARCEGISKKVGFQLDYNERAVIE
jgi:hypothetical protein